MNTLPHIKCTAGTLQQRDVVFLRFAFNDALRLVVKAIPGAKYSSTEKDWYFFKEDFNLNTCFQALRGKAYLDYSELKKKTPQKLPERHIKKADYSYRSSTVLPKGYSERLILKGYGEQTNKTYIAYMKDFVNYFKGRILEDVSVDDINAYLLHLIKTRHISKSQQNQRVSAIKFYYEKVLGRNKEYYNIQRPKKEFHLPKVISEKEVLAILHSIKNIKHKAIIATIYSAGLRRSELLNLRKEDLCYDKSLIFVRGGKGKKDRTTIFSDSLKIVIRKYIEEKKPKYWLFEGNNHKKYSSSSVATLLDNAAQKAGIQQHVTPHMLRHSFATHLMDKGTSTRIIQSLLGHESSKTTEIYTHISERSLNRIKNPLDAIIEDNDLADRRDDKNTYKRDNNT